MSLTTLNNPGVGVERWGIRRTPITSRFHTDTRANFWMWFTSNFVYSTVALGTLPLVLFQVGLIDSLVAIIVGNVLGVLPVALFSQFGPLYGLRQMVFTRLSFGWNGAKIMAFLNVLACVGWSAVNATLGAQLAVSVTHGAISFGAAVAAITALTAIVSIFGYRYIHGYERFMWLPMAVVFAFLAVIAVQHVHIIPPGVSGWARIAGDFSYGAAIYGFATGWSSYAADYNVNQPVDTPKRQVFWNTYLGVFSACVLLETVGLFLSTGFAGTGGDVISAALKPFGLLGEITILVIIVSTIANNIPNDYSLGLSVQVFGKAFERVNRVVWTILGTLVYFGLALVFGQNFAYTFQSFLLIIAYWLGIYAIVVILDHYVYRRGRYPELDNFDAHSYDDPHALPSSIPGITAIVLGIVGISLGISQVFVVGSNTFPVVGLVAGLVNKPYGIDVGFELAIILAAIGYVLAHALFPRTTPARN